LDLGAFEVEDPSGIKDKGGKPGKGGRPGKSLRGDRRPDGSGTKAIYLPPAGSPDGVDALGKVQG
jgi:hypothetical protein